MLKKINPSSTPRFASKTISSLKMTTENFAAAFKGSRIQVCGTLEEIPKQENNIVVHFEEVLVDLRHYKSSLEDGDSELPLSTRSGFKAFFQELSSSYNIVIYTSYFSIEAIERALTEEGVLDLYYAIYSTKHSGRHTKDQETQFWADLDFSSTVFITSEEQKKSLPFQISNLIAIDFSTSDKILTDLVDFFMVNQIQSEANELVVSLQEKFTSFLTDQSKQINDTPRFNYSTSESFMSMRFRIGGVPDSLTHLQISIPEHKIPFQSKPQSAKIRELDSSELNKASITLPSQEDFSTDDGTPTRRFTPSMEKLRKNTAP